MCIFYIARTIGSFSFPSCPGFIRRFNINFAFPSSRISERVISVSSFDVIIPETCLFMYYVICSSQTLTMCAILALTCCFYGLAPRMKRQFLVDIGTEHVADGKTERLGTVLFRSHFTLFPS